MKNIDILIVSEKDVSKNKIFKEILKQNRFKEINFKLVNINKNFSEKYKSNLIIVLGDEHKSKFNIDLDNVIGKVIKHDLGKIFFTYDVSDITNTMDFMYDVVNSHFKKISELYFKSKSKSKKVLIDENKIQKQCHSYKLPDWCYDENHILIDIQYNKYQNKLIFIFRDQNGKKKYHYENSKKRYFYVNQTNIKDSEIIKDISEVELHFNTIGLLEDVAIYEGDLSPELKHSIDYQYNRKVPEKEWKLRKLFWDIEVYTGDYVGFPFPLEANFPINSISFQLDLEGDTYVYLLRVDGMDLSSYTNDTDKSTENLKSILQKNDEIKKYKIEIFDSEEELIIQFIKKVHELDPDILAGWNTDRFDVPYLVNRMHKLNIDLDLLSPIGQTDINISEYFKTVIYGYYFLDQLTLYKKLTQNVEESYKLSTISQKVLGADKVAYEGTINTMYEGDLVRFILYSGTDTELLAELEDALNHIQLNLELIKTCCSTWRRSETTTGIVDPLLLKFAKDRNKVCRNKLINSREYFSGAYVLEPKVGYHKWVCDFDFKSLYPSIILSLNLGPNTYKAKINEDIAQLYLYHFEHLPNKIEIIKNPILSSKEIIEVDPQGLKDFIEKNNYILSINGCMLEQHDKELSFFYEVLKYLGDMRDNYKKQLGDLRQHVYDMGDKLSEKEKYDIDIEMKKLDNKQMVVKVVANSIYGIISTPHFRMFNIDIAKAITSTGQEALKFSIFHLSKYMKEDSLKINMNYLQDFEKSELPYIAYGDSVGKDSIITLENNNISIENLWNLIETKVINKNNKEIKLCDIKVLSSDDNKNSVFLNCSEIIRHKVNKNIYKIYLTNETELIVTEDHSLIKFDDNMNYTDIKPTNASYVLLNKYIPRNIIDSKYLSKEEYELFGYWIGNGSYNRIDKSDPYICISTGLDTNEFIEKILLKLKNNNIISNYYISKNNYDIKLLSNSFKKLMMELKFEGTSKTKKIPEFLFKENDKNIKHFIRGYFSADGSITNSSISVSSVNKDLLSQTKLLLKYCGISSNIIKDTRGNTYNSNNVTSYTYILRIQNKEDFMNKIGFIFDRKNNNKFNISQIIIPRKYRNEYRLKRRNYSKSEFVKLNAIQDLVPNHIIQKIQNYDVIPKKITKIEKIEYNDYVYDLCVPETQKFFANDILVHNTDSAFVLIGDYLKDNELI